MGSESEVLYEVVLIPKCPELRRDLDPRFLTYSPDPLKALHKVLDHLDQGSSYHDRSLYDYTVRGRTLVE